MRPGLMLLFLFGLLCRPEAIQAKPVGSECIDEVGRQISAKCQYVKAEIRTKKLPVRIDIQYINDHPGKKSDDFDILIGGECSFRGAATSTDGVASFLFKIRGGTDKVYTRGITVEVRFDRLDFYELDNHFGAKPRDEILCQIKTKNVGNGMMSFDFVWRGSVEEGQISISMHDGDSLELHRMPDDTEGLTFLGISMWIWILLGILVLLLVISSIVGTIYFCCKTKKQAEVQYVLAQGDASSVQLPDEKSKTDNVSSSRAVIQKSQKSKHAHIDQKDKDRSKKDASVSTVAKTKVESKKTGRHKRSKETQDSDYSDLGDINLVHMSDGNQKSVRIQGY